MVTSCEGQGKNGRWKSIWMNQVEEGSVKAGFIREDALWGSQ